jgi:hypothetical protein
MRCESAYLSGAICPERAVVSGIVAPYADTEAMNEHLKENAKTVTPGAHAALIFDGAGNSERSRRRFAGMTSEPRALIRGGAGGAHEFLQRGGHGMR